MKIIHFIPSIDKRSGGTAIYMQMLSKYLGKEIDLYIITFQTPTPLKLENCTLIFLKSNWKYLLKLKKEWSQILYSISPDVVHINCCWQPESAFIQKWSQKKGFTVILTPHGMLKLWIIARNYWTKKLPALFLYQKSAIKHVNLLHVTSEIEKEHLLKLGYNNNIVVIPNAIEIENNQLKKEWVITKKILFLSRIHQQKGIELLIDAIFQIKQKLNGYQLIIAGEGDQNYINSLKYKVNSYNLTNIISFVGGVYNEDKWELFKQVDFFILPSYSENFGIVIAESLASGTPVITTTETPWMEINSINCGWCIELSTENLANAIENAINKSPIEIKDMGVAGRKLIEQKYSISEIYIQFKNLYQNIKNQMN